MGRRAAPGQAARARARLLAIPDHWRPCTPPTGLSMMLSPLRYFSCCPPSYLYLCKPRKHPQACCVVSRRVMPMLI